MRKTIAIFKKQFMDTWYNKSVLLQFVLLPILALIMGYLMPEGAMPRQSVSAMFTTMYVGMIPISSMCSIIAEEREKGTLRSLRMANVGGGQYLIGIGSCLFVASLFGVAIFSVLGGYTGEELAQYIAISILGILTSLLLGATIGLLAKNQMSATSLSAPMSIVLSFMPTMATMNEEIAKISKFLYTQQLNNLLQDIGNEPFTKERLIILCSNIALFCLAFAIIYRKKGLRD